MRGTELGNQSKKIVVKALSVTPYLTDTQIKEIKSALADVPLAT